jgi:hypothetical protein
MAGPSMFENTIVFTALEKAEEALLASKVATSTLKNSLKLLSM